MPCLRRRRRPPVNQIACRALRRGRAARRGHRRRRGPRGLHAIRSTRCPGRDRHMEMLTAARNSGSPSSRECRPGRFCGRPRTPKPHRRSVRSRRGPGLRSSIPRTFRPGSSTSVRVEAGEILQKLRPYGVRLAVVREPGLYAPSRRFHELLAAERRGLFFDIFDTRRRRRMAGRGLGAGDRVLTGAVSPVIPRPA